MVAHTYRNILAHVGKAQRDLEDLAAESVAERLVLQSEIQFLRAVLDCVPDAMAFSDDTGRFFMWNRSATELSHLPTMDTPPNDWAENFRVFGLDHSPIPVEQLPLLKALRDGRPHEGEYVVESAGKKQRMRIWADAVEYKGARRGVLVWRVLDEY